MVNVVYVAVAAGAAIILAIVAYEIWKVFHEAEKIVNDVIEVFKKIYKAIVDAVEAVINFFEKIPAWIVSWVQAAYQDILDTLRHAGLELQKVSDTLHGYAVQTEAQIKAAADTIGTIATKAMQNINTMMKTLADGMQKIENAVSPVISAIGAGAKAGYDGMKGAVKTLADDAGKAASAIGGAVSALGKL